MHRILFVTLLSLMGTALEAAEPLNYQTERAVVQQGQNMAEIERELDMLAARAAQGPNPQQQALMAQFQALLAANPALKAQFEAASPEEQAAAMAQMGIASSVGDFAWLEQRLDSVERGIAGAPKTHPDVAALYQRVKAARATIAQTRNMEAAGTQSALAANDASEYPQFEEHLNLALNMAGQLANSLSVLRRMAAEAPNKPKSDDMWLLSNVIGGDELRRAGQAISRMDAYASQIQQWESQYQPLFAQSTVYKSKWYADLQYLPELIKRLSADAAPALNTLALVAQHNAEVINGMIDYATERRMTAYFDGGIAQANREITLAIEAYPDTPVPGAPPKQRMTAIGTQVDGAIEAGLAALEDLKVAEQRLPPDSYSGDDKEDLKAKAVALVNRQFAGEEVLAVRICCDWDVENYEEIVERVPGEWIKQRVHYRDIQIGVLMPAQGDRNLIRVVGIRQNFVSNKELVELLRELPILKKNSR